MTTFNDRERGFENKFALDQDQEFKAGARRNRLLGEWAAGLMGLEGDRVAEYAKAVIKSDFELPGDDDVLRQTESGRRWNGTGPCHRLQPQTLASDPALCGKWSAAHRQ